MLEKPTEAQRNESSGEHNLLYRLQLAPAFMLDGSGTTLYFCRRTDSGYLNPGEGSKRHLPHRIERKPGMVSKQGRWFSRRKDLEAKDQGPSEPKARPRSRRSLRKRILEKNYFAVSPSPSFTGGSNTRKDLPSAMFQTRRTPSSPPATAILPSRETSPE